MKTLIKTIQRILLIITLAIVLSVGFLFVQEPLVMSRLGGMLLGKKPGVQKIVMSGDGLSIKSNLGEKTINQQTLNEAIAYARETKSHALLVFHQGELQLEEYFPGYDKKTLSDTNSMHKTILAILIGIAIDQGFIENVDESASNYLSEWAKDERMQITIKQLLQQSSGIRYPPFSFNPTGEWMKFMNGDDTQNIALNQPLEKTPNSEFAYNGINPQNLGLLLERATKKSYSDYLSENLWRYMKDDAFVTLDAEKHATTRMFCCLDATARDLLRIGLLILNKGKLGDSRIVSETWIREMITPSDLNPNYGYLTWLGTEYQENRIYNNKSSATGFHSEPFVDEDIVFLDGFGGQRAYIIPSKDLVIIRTGAIVWDWDDAKLPNTISKGVN